MRFCSTIRNTIATIAFGLIACQLSYAHPSYTRLYVDESYGGNGKPGWVRAADMDLDTDIDIVAGGGNALFVYENDGNESGWTRYGSLTSGGTSIGANGGELYDVDGDGDWDVISARNNGIIAWWENPGGVLSNHIWTMHTIYNQPGGDTYFMHDFRRFDIDGDGTAEEFVANLNDGYWNADIKIHWFRIPADPTQLWDVYTIEAFRNEGTPHGHAGFSLGDIDGDGHDDLAYANGWYEAPDDPTNAWTWHEVTTFYGISNDELRDMDGDGKLDLVVSGGHHGQGVVWFKNPADPINDTWASNNIDHDVVHPEGLAVLDTDGDLDLDVIASELFFGEAPGEPDWSDQEHNIYHYENVSNSMVWVETNIAPTSYPSHLLQMVDINQDGNLDIISESAGHSVISYYENQAPPVCDPVEIGFDLTVVDPAYGGNGKPGWSTAGDVDDDGINDVVSGGGGALQWYKGPTYQRHVIENPTAAGGNGGVLHDVDGDNDLDLVAALVLDDLVWWENPGGIAATGTWTRHTVDNTITEFNHDLVKGDIDGDSEDEFVALYVDGGVYWYDVPTNPAAGNWPRTRILNTISDPFVGLALGDLDRDGDVDVVAANKWYENPVAPTSTDWTAYTVFTGAVQNVMCFDVNRDRRLDVVAAEGFNFPNGRVLWAQAPTNAKTESFIERVVATGLDGPENIWAGDLNNDWVPDIVSGAMGTFTGWGDNDSTLIYFAGQGTKGTDWVTRVLATNVGVSARIQPIDIDKDGDLDFTADGNAEDHIYLWVNTSACASAASPGGGIAPVSFIPAAGNFSDPISVTMTTITVGASIYYTSNGAVPTMSSMLYINPVMVYDTVTLKTRAFNVSGTASSAVTSATFTRVPPPTLVGYWPFDEGAGPTATNVTGYGYDGTLVEALWSSDDISCSTNAIEFDGVDDRVDIGALDISGTQLTIAAWIKADDFDVGDARIVSKASNGAAVQDHYWMLSTDFQSPNYLLRFRLKTSGNTDTLVANSGALQVGVWAHVAAVYDGTNMALYKDAVNVGNLGKTGPITESGSVNVSFGNQPLGADNKPFDGIIDDVRIYNRALSQLELGVLATQATACALGLEEYEVWAIDQFGSHLTSGAGKWDDPDGDGCINFYEFGQGGTGTNMDCHLIQPWGTVVTQQFRFHYRKDASNMNYQVEGTPKVMTPAWSNLPSLEVDDGGGEYWRGYPVETNQYYFRLHMFAP